MKPNKPVLIAIAIAALTASSAVAQNTVARRNPMPRTSSNIALTTRSHAWANHHHCRPRSSVYFDFGFGYPFGYGYPGYYPYGYSYYARPRAVVYQTVATSGSIVVEVQKRLARAGCYRGAIDGVIGNETRRAIRMYERGHGLPVDGRLDQQLLATMGLA